MLGDRDQGQADVADPGQHSVERGLVDDRSVQDGGAVGSGQCHPVQPGGPPGVEAPLEADLVPAGVTSLRVTSPFRRRRSVLWAAVSAKLGAEVMSARHHL